MTSKKQTSGAISMGDKQLLNKEQRVKPKHFPIAPKFPLCSKYGLKPNGGCELALSKAEENGMLEGYKQSQEKMSELRMQIKGAKNKVYSCGNCLQLEAERDGLESCCRVLEKALGVRKGADLKEIEVRVKELKDLEKKGALAEQERIIKKFDSLVDSRMTLGKVLGIFSQWIHEKAELSKK